MTKKTVISHQRADRLLVSRGVGGRKEVQKLLRRGHVFYEDQELRDPSQRVPVDACFLIDGEPCDPLPALIAYHKPIHQLCTMKDPWGRSGLDHVLPPKWREAFHPVGRLDADTTGLLLFSSDGTLTQYLLHPKRNLVRRYRAVINALPENLGESLTEGVETSLGKFTAHVERIEPFDRQKHQQYFVDFTQQEESLDQAQGIIWLTVTEGKYRMVRRMLHNAGASVLALHREVYGTVELEDLAVGTYRVVSKEILDNLKP